MYYWEHVQMRFSMMDGDIRVSEQNVILIIIMTFTYIVVDALARMLEEMTTEMKPKFLEFNYWDSPFLSGGLDDDIMARIAETGNPEVFFAQGEWMMVGYPPYENCDDLLFTEWITKQSPTNPNQTIIIVENKECIRSERLTWFWIHPFTPEKEHEFVVYKYVNGNYTVVFHENFTSLPVLPPDIDYIDITGGAGWIFVKIQPGFENLTNLLGYDIYYRRKGDSYWWRTYIDTVIYSEEYPYVRPVHYCPTFRINGTMCVLVSDGVWFDAERENTVKYEFRIKPYRIYPGGKTMGTTSRVQFLHKYCDWEIRDCYPPVDKDFPDFNITTTVEPKATNTTTASTTHEDKPDPNTAAQVIGINTTLPPEWWLQNKSQSRPPLNPISDDDIFAILFGLLLIALSIIPPCAVCLGRRCGHHAASKRWVKLSSKKGNVHIPLRSVA